MTDVTPTPPQKERSRRVETLIGQALGPEKVAALYDALGFKQPKDRPRRQGKKPVKNVTHSSLSKAKEED